MAAHFDELQDLASGIPAARRRNHEFIVERKFGLLVGPVTRLSVLIGVDQKAGQSERTGVYASLGYGMGGLVADQRRCSLVMATIQRPGVPQRKRIECLDWTRDHALSLDSFRKLFVRRYLMPVAKIVLVENGRRDDGTADVDGERIFGSLSDKPEAALYQRIMTDLAFPVIRVGYSHRQYAPTPDGLGETGKSRAEHVVRLLAQELRDFGGYQVLVSERSTPRKVLSRRPSFLVGDPASSRVRERQNVRDDLHDAALTVAPTATKAVVSSQRSRSR